MPRKVIEVGVEGNDGTGDGIREAFIKSNDNFQELYAISGGQFTSSLADPTGYVQFDNGTLFAWGSGTTDGSGNYIVSWPTELSIDSIKSITATPRTDQKAIAIVSQSDTATFTITTYKITDSTAISDVPVTWFAVGFAQ